MRLNAQFFNNGHESLVKTLVTEISTEHFVTQLSSHRSLHPSASEHNNVECQCVESSVREGSVPEPQLSHDSRDERSGR